MVNALKRALYRAVRATILKISSRVGLYSLVALYRYSALAEDGWFRSFKDHRSTTREGDPLPWFAYPAIDFLADRLPPSLEVFEYGSGNSTLWWADRVKRIVAVEHDPSFVEELRSQLPRNAAVHHIPDLDAYEKSCLTLGKDWDIVVIDGERREACAPYAVSSLALRGVIILDDTERGRWPLAIKYLSDAGFRRIDFVGLHPMHVSRSATSIFYRDGNCLGL